MKVCTTTILYLFFARCFFVPKVCTYVHRAKSVFSLDYIIKKVIEKLRKPQVPCISLSRFSSQQNLALFKTYFINVFTAIFN